jgi:hypothetical protein
MQTRRAPKRLPVGGATDLQTTASLFAEAAEAGGAAGATWSSAKAALENKIAEAAAKQINPVRKAVPPSLSSVNLRKNLSGANPYWTAAHL